MNILDRILENKRWEIAKRKENFPLNFLLKQKRSYPSISLVDSISESSFSLICEFKRKSPSINTIIQDADPTKTAIAYTDLGAAGISVITDKKYFNGSLKDLAQIKSVTHLPILRKDFIIDEYQLIEAVKAGADAVLLIADILDLATLTRFYDKAKNLNLDVIVEIHHEKHAYKLKAFEPEIVGVNSRNLNTMKIDLFRFQKLISHLPKNSIYIAESGISSKKDIQFVSELGYQGALIGTSIMEDINLLNTLIN